MTKRKKSEADGMAPQEVSAQVSTTPSQPSAVAPDAAVSTAPSVEELQRGLEELQRGLEDVELRNRDLFTRLQYAQADLENVRKRAEREIVDAVRFANERLLGSLLPVIDQFDAAAASVEAASATGLGMVRDHLLKVLREAGLEEVPTDGAFDPYVHEAVGRVNDAALPEGSIVEVVQKGYRFNFRLLRPAKVIVVRKEGET